MICFSFTYHAECMTALNPVQNHEKDGTIRKIYNELIVKS